MKGGDGYEETQSFEAVPSSAKKPFARQASHGRFARRNGFEMGNQG